MRFFLLALQFLTIIPLRFREEAKKEELSRSIAFFPLAGLLIGVCLIVLDFILSYTLPTSIVRAVLILFLIVITGGLHIDGMADTIDAVSSGEGGKRALEIMRESTVGVMGVCAVVMSLLLKYIALGEFFGMRLYAILLFFPMIGRISIVIACFLFPYARVEGKGEAFIGKVAFNDFITASLLSFIMSFLLLQLRGVLIMGFSILTVVLVGKYFTKKYGGITGDILGFVNEVGEIVALIGVTMVI